MVAGDIETTDDNAFYKSKPTVVETGRKQVIQATLPFHNAAELLAVCTRENMTIAQVVFENERRWRSDVEIRRGLLELWRTMDASITNGCWSTQSHLPGGLNVRRRAPQLFKRLMEKSLVRPVERHFTRHTQTHTHTHTYTHQWEAIVLGIHTDIHIQTQTGALTDMT